MPASRPQSRSSQSWSGIGYGVRQNDLIIVPHRSAGIDHVGNVAFALRWLRPQQRFDRTRQHLGGIVLVEQRRADRISSDRSDAMREQQPAFIEFDR